MITTRDAVELRRCALPEHGEAGGGYVAILRCPGGKIAIKRFVLRGFVVNLVDRYERLTGSEIETLPLDEQTANQIVDAVLAGNKSWAACFLVGDIAAQMPIAWTKSEAEHKYTSTGVKFWRHRAAMESYRAGTGRTVVSTHVSPEGTCNLKCPYCSVTYRDTHARIELGRIKKYIADLKSRGLRAVILTGGGEPVAYPAFNELVQWIRAQGLSVALITNGTLSRRVRPETWRCFSWVRVSINVFDGWRSKIRIPRDQLAPDCVVGCSLVYSVEHEATRDEVPLGRAELFAQVAEVADACGAEYIRVLPNCLLEQDQLILEHRSIQKIADKLGDSRFFQQYKVHGAPASDVCHQAYFRPYLSEEAYVGADGEGDGEPGTVYPCDSVVLNDSRAHFARQYQICKPENVLDFLDGKIGMGFDPKRACSGCVFTSNVEQLGAWKECGAERFGEFPEPLVHEEFV